MGGGNEAGVVDEEAHGEEEVMMQGEDVSLRQYHNPTF